MEEFFEIAVPITAIFVGLPWLILHYVTKWKTAPTLTNDDEQMLGDIHELARRLEGWQDGDNPRAELGV